MKPLASLLFVAVTILGVSSQCHRQFKLFQGQCYRYGEMAVTWTEAQTICLSSGGKLAEILSREENEFVKNMAKEKRSTCVWVGGIDIFHEGTWEWASTSNSFRQFTDWASGQPNNYNGGQRCLNLYGEFNYAWDDTRCTDKCNFVCTKPSTNVVVGK